MSVVILPVVRLERPGVDLAHQRVAARHCLGNVLDLHRIRVMRHWERVTREALAAGWDDPWPPAGKLAAGEPEPAA
jgi:hypothetical protein